MAGTKNSPAALLREMFGQRSVVLLFLPILMMCFSACASE